MTHRRLQQLAVVVLAAVVWVVEHVGDVFPHLHLTDLPVYESAAERIAGGQVPYRDFAFEYPPLAAGVMFLTRLVPLPYDVAFSGLMLASLVATALAGMAIARSLGHTRRRELGVGVVVAVLPILFGDFIATRFDLLVVALTAWTLWAAVTRRFTWMWALAAAAVAAKLAPVVIVPLLAIWHLRCADARTVRSAAGWSAAGVVATFAPFALVAPGGVADMFSYHLDRPLEIESLGASFLLALHAVGDLGVEVTNSFGSQNVLGTAARLIAPITSALTVAGVAVLAVLAYRWLPRRPHDRDGAALLTFVGATFALALSTSKVLSPQYMLWLIPATLLVHGGRGRRAFALTVAVLVATQLYFPDRYWDLFALNDLPIWLLVLRNALLVALVATVWPRTAPLRRRAPKTA